MNLSRGVNSSRRRNRGQQQTSPAKKGIEINLTRDVRNWRGWTVLEKGRYKKQE
jgi:hypothetical protein